MQEWFIFNNSHEISCLPSKTKYFLKTHNYIFGHSKFNIYFKIKHRILEELARSVTLTKTLLL